MSDLKSVENEWQSPSAIWRSAPFWSWNSELEPERLQAEIQMMHDSGMGGAFMHSRYGLKTPYLSERWFECVSAVVEKCRELDMHAYMYDEDRWPSGPAGGFVTREHPEFRLKYLVYTWDERHEAAEEDVAIFDVELDDEQRLVSYHMIDSPDDAENRALIFMWGLQEVTGWTNDGGYLDTMNPDAVAKFISVTHDAYAERYGDEMGTIIPAVFTDEPSYGAQIHGGQRVPWTLALLDEFKARRGYDLREKLPEIVLPPADDSYSRTRHDYFQTCMELFVEAYSKQIGEWCAEHDIAATGHMLAGRRSPASVPPTAPACRTMSGCSGPASTCFAIRSESLPPPSRRPRWPISLGTSACSAKPTAAPAGTGRSRATSSAETGSGRAG